MTLAPAVLISLLHEDAASNSATRLFRQRPVLEWTLRRLQKAQRIGSVAIICWDDQKDLVTETAASFESRVLSQGERRRIASLDAVSAARRWSDGWRGGLNHTCDFDAGFHAAAVKDSIDAMETNAAILVDPAAALVDPQLIDAIVAHAENENDVEIFFAPAAPGLGGALIRRSLLERLATVNTHPGRLLHYLPDQPMHDPLSGKGCVAVPAPVARTTRHFKLNSQRQIDQLSVASEHLNGQLITSDSLALVDGLRWQNEVNSLPREIVIELNTNRNTSPIFWPGQKLEINRTPMSLPIAKKLLEHAAQADDIRITFAGVGDPLLHENIFELVAYARELKIKAIHIETDLLPTNDTDIDRLVDAEVDVVSVHLPALLPATYAAMMGRDGHAQVLANIRRFLSRRAQRGAGVPILTPLFVKSQRNLADMEMWYDQWLKAIDSAVIIGPSTFGDAIVDRGVGDMSPPKRKPCARLWSRVTILSDGSAVTCDQDVLGQQPLGNLATQSLAEIWRNKTYRDAHARGCWSEAPACGACKEWHRP